MRLWRKAPPWSAYAIAGVVWLAALTALMIPTLQRKRAEAMAEAAAWTIEGRPCPQRPPAEAATWPYKTRQGFDYAGATFAFGVGHVACAHIHDDGGRAMFRGHPVCQFTSPAVVEVRTGRTTAFFTPGLGQRATVSVRDGVVRCVMAGRFYGQNNF